MEFRVTREHPEAKHCVIVSYQGQVVSIATQGKTRIYDVGDRDAEQVWTVLVRSLQDMNPKQALYKFTRLCDTLTRLYSPRDLKYVASSDTRLVVG